MYTLYTDTDTDMTPAKAEKYGYKLISMPYTIDGVETFPYIDFDTFDAHAFYNILRAGKLPSTSAISPSKYIEYFEPELKEGKDVVYVHFSKAMSGTFNALNIALNDLKAKYPDRTVYLIDTKAITTLSYAIVNEIGELYKNGATIEELLAWAEKEVNHWSIYFYADDLKFFRRSGRVSGFSAFMGNLIGIHPIIYMSEEGIMTNVSKARGKINTFNKILDYVAELGDDIENHRIYIGHADCIELAEKLAEMLKERFGSNLDIEFVEVNPTAGSHCGPDGMGVVFHCKHR